MGPDRPYHWRCRWHHPPHLHFRPGLIRAVVDQILSVDDVVELVGDLANHVHTSDVLTIPRDFSLPVDDDAVSDTYGTFYQSLFECFIDFIFRIKRDGEVDLDIDANFTLGPVVSFANLPSYLAYILSQSATALSRKCTSPAPCRHTCR